MHPQSWSFRQHLAVAFLLGLALRVVFTIVTKGDSPPTVDGPWYVDTARMVDEGNGVIFPWIHDRWGGSFQTAQHTPLFMLYVLASTKLLGTSTLLLRLAAGLLGATGILIGGGLGREVGGRRVGIVLAWLVALNPLVWINDAEVQSESGYIPIVLGTLWAAYRLHRSPDLRRAAVLGAMLGVSILTRSEAVVLCLLIAVPVIANLVQLPWMRRIQLLATCAVVVLAFNGPWIAYNLTRFETRVWISTSAGGALPQANCQETFYGEKVGYTSFGCWFSRTELPIGPNDTNTGIELDEEHCRCDRDDWKCVNEVCMLGDEGAYANYGTQQGLHYIRNNLDRLPYVLPVRVLRNWELYHPLQDQAWDVDIDSRNQLAGWAGLLWFYASIPFWIWGLVLMRRRGSTLLPISAYAISVNMAVLVAGAVTRYRLSFDLAVLVPMAVAVAAMLDRRDAVATAEEPQASISA